MRLNSLLSAVLLLRYHVHSTRQSSPALFPYPLFALCSCHCTLLQLVGPIIMEKETAAHSSILAWRIPWTEEPGGLLSMGSQRVPIINRKLTGSQDRVWFINVCAEYITCQAWPCPLFFFCILVGCCPSGFDLCFLLLPSCYLSLFLSFVKWKKHNLEIENYVLFHGLSEDFDPEASRIFHLQPGGKLHWDSCSKIDFQWVTPVEPHTAPPDPYGFGQVQAYGFSGVLVERMAPTSSAALLGVSSVQ